MAKIVSWACEGWGWGLFRIGSEIDVSFSGIGLIL